MVKFTVLALHPIHLLVRSEFIVICNDGFCVRMGYLYRFIVQREQKYLLKGFTMTEIC